MSSYSAYEHRLLSKNRDHTAACQIKNPCSCPYFIAKSQEVRKISWADGLQKHLAKTVYFAEKSLFVEKHAHKESFRIDLLLDCSWGAHGDFAKLKRRGR